MSIIWGDDRDDIAYWDDRDEPEPLTEDEIAEDAIHDAQERDLDRGLYD